MAPCRQSAGCFDVSVKQSSRTRLSCRTRFLDCCKNLHSLSKCMHDLHLLDEFCQMLITACQREHFREDSVVLRRQARQTGKACQLLVGHEAASPTECGHCHLLLHRIVKDGILLERTTTHEDLFADQYRRRVHNTAMIGLPECLSSINSNGTRSAKPVLEKASEMELPRTESHRFQLQKMSCMADNDVCKSGNASRRANSTYRPKEQSKLPFYQTLRVHQVFC